mgnify:CR=1 FL=1
MALLLLKLLGILITILLVIICTICVLNFQLLKSKVPFIILFCFIALICQLVSTFLAIGGINNLWILRVYTFGEFTLLSLFYYHVLKLNPTRQRVDWALAFIILLLALMVYSSIYIEPLSGYNSITKSMECLYMSGLSIYYYIREIRALKDVTKKETQKESLLLINTGILLLFSGQFFIYLMSNYMMVHIPNVRGNILWLFNGLLNFLFYSILLVGIWKLVSPRKKFSGSY